VFGWLWWRRRDPLDEVTGDVRLIVGLGNPGPDYADTRHNVGFRCVDVLAERLGTRWTQRGETLVSLSDGLGLAKPQAYMNRSGPPVTALVQRLQLAPDRLLVVYDDMDLPFGLLRLRPRGGAGTHNGMRSVIATLGTEDFARLRIGISQASAGSAVDHVLSPFSPDELPELHQLVQRAADAALAWANEGAEAAMNRYNNRA
jgi:PTH1 family peptidyl-tRNA hydrolase